MASLYQQISRNKYKSAFLVVLVLVLVLGVVALYSYTARGDFALPIMAALFAIPSTLLGYLRGDKIALAINRARELQDAEAPELHNILENLAIVAGIPKPKLYIIDSPALNAFATGRDPEHASVAVTRGLAAHLTRAELEGVLAHELSHIQNYDVRFATLVAIFVGFIAILSDLFLRATVWGGFRSRENREQSNQLGVLLVIVGMVLLVVAPIIAKLIQLAVSRQREFLADASAAMLTRYPDGLAQALEKIAAGPALSTASHATAHLFIANPFKVRSWGAYFSTHPPVEERIKRLRESM